MGFDKHYSFNYFIKNAVVTKIFPKIVRVFLAATGIYGFNLFMPEDHDKCCLDLMIHSNLKGTLKLIINS